jgi:hypothetical protein
MSITHCPANGTITATATSDRVWFSFTATRTTTASNWCAQARIIELGCERKAGSRPAHGWRPISHRVAAFSTPIKSPRPTTANAAAGSFSRVLRCGSKGGSTRATCRYSHVRMAPKRTALDKLESGLMGRPSVDGQSAAGLI